MQTIAKPEKIFQGIFLSIALLIVICLFAISDHFLHGLENAWSVPDYYFVDKIPAGFLWGLVGLLLAAKLKNIWFKSMIVAGVIAVALQVRYFIEGYALNFVLLFLLFHFLILYFLSLIMFLVFKNIMLINNYNKMKKIIIALAALIVVGLGTYYLVFNNNAYKTATNNSATEIPAVSVNTVEIKNFSFNPAVLRVKAGAKATWVNNDSVPHSIDSDVGNLLDSPTILPGQSFSFTFTDAAAVNYHCGLHPNMKGEIVVE